MVGESVFLYSPECILSNVGGGESARLVDPSVLTPSPNASASGGYTDVALWVHGQQWVTR